MWARLGEITPDLSGGVPLLTLLGSIGLLLGYAVYASFAATQVAGDTLVQVGGTKLAAQEAVVSSVLSVVLILCVVLFGRLQAEMNDRYTAETVGAWQFGVTAGSGGEQDRIVRWLLQAERQADDEAFLDQQTGWAVSLTDAHRVTQASLGTLDAVIRSVLWFVVVATGLQTLLVSRRLHGLRIVMPFTVVVLLVVFLVSIPSTHEFASLLWQARNGTGKF